MKVLVITPRSPFTLRGACERDRNSGIRDLMRLGHTVRVITKTFPQDLPDIETARQELGIPIVAVPYQPQGRSLRKILARILRPSRWDGAAAEYFDPVIQKEVEAQCDEFIPDLVWVDYTYLWPLYHIPKSRNIPIITRSINYEPQHFLEEEGWSLARWLRALPKYVTERRTVRLSTVMASITPKEEKIYHGLGATKLRTLPLRDLPNRLGTLAHVHDREKLNLIFVASSYAIPHNREALRFLLAEVMPLVEKATPGTFTLHAVGAKFPDSMNHLLTPSVKLYPSVNLNDLFPDMDIAIIPSLFGAGMQQKIFEPICRGFPTITSERGLVDYPYRIGEDVLAATTPQEFAEAILSLRSFESRRRIAENGVKRSHELFSREELDHIITALIHDATGK